MNYAFIPTINMYLYCINIKLNIYYIHVLYMYHNSHL